VAGISRITKTPHQQRCAQFTGMSASIPAVTSLRDFFRFSSLLLSSAPFLDPKPHRNRIFHRRHPRIHPVTPNGIRHSATQGNQDGYRVSTLSLRESFRCIYPRRYTQTISVTLFACNSAATSLSPSFSKKIRSRRTYANNVYPISYKSAFISRE